MLRAIATELQAVIATKFGYTATDSLTSGPRDVVWLPDQVAFRERAEQSSELVRGVEAQMPFLSFWRTGMRLNKGRRNIPQASDGVATADSNLAKYKLIPVDMAFQIEFWADEVVDFEGAIESWYKWAWPPTELVLTDVSDVVFPLTMDFGDAQDNSLLQQRREVGDIYRASFPLTVLGYVVESGGTFKTIKTIKWDIYDYSATEEVEGAVLIKAMDDITE